MEDRFLRILHFGRFWSDNMGGVERHVDILLTELAKRQVHCVNLVANDAHRGKTEHAERNGYAVVKAASFGVKFRTAMSPALIAQMRHLHQEQPFDLVHAHFPDPLTHLALAFLPRHIPRVITWHSDLVPYPALQKLYLPFVHSTLRSASAIVAATPAHLQSSQIPAGIPASRRHVIPYGMDFTPFDATEATLAAARQLRQLHGGGPLVFAMGRHVAYKGFDVLIRAMAALPQARLVLGGTGPLLAAHQELAWQLGITDRVHFAGRIEEADLAAHYHACDVFCLPSVGETEGFGLVQLEAMACGKPVVCSLLGNGVNYVSQHGQTGFATPRGDAASLAKALGQLLGDPAMARAMGEAGRTRAHDGYSLDAMTTPMLALYASLTA